MVSHPTLNILCIAGLLSSAAPSVRAGDVALELVLATDASTSVDAAEFALQQQGLAAAFRDPLIVDAIRASGSIAVAVVQWSGKGQVVVSTDWRRIHDADEAAAFSTEILATPRKLGGFTDIGGALGFSMREIEENEFIGQRRVIDLSGDGTSSEPGTARIRDDIVARNIVINALAIRSFEIDLGQLADDILLRHFENEVTGGAGAFVMVAADYKDFARAIRLKLLREIRGPMIAQSIKGAVLAAR